MTLKVAVITGGASGLGKGISERLAKDGYAIVISDINEQLLSSTEQEFKHNGYKVITQIGNVAIKEDQEALAQKAVEHFGRIDVWVNNAGIESVVPFEKITKEQLEKVFAVDVFSVVYGIQAAAEVMKNQEGIGKIINACSIAGHESYEMLATYCAAKHAVRSLTVAAAKEYAKFNIRVNSYCPGVAATSMWDRVDAAMAEVYGWASGEAMQKFSAGILCGRTEEPEDVGNIVSFLASDNSNYITGQSIIVDGGMVFN
ncbi:acetoin reductase [Acinetobacter sichuanensis]|uniref:acetoin reductase n=1 Tax=Acinetobacter sichuanensis TaxID=2136183 RepID=UPI00280E7486|nr:acetoin reductase [Acinetobacter sichuanensis]MDQ9023242.1 acetoin reductase [Acinetobacter sichuanensis]